jgi:hypothetical protein
MTEDEKRKLKEIWDYIEDVQQEATLDPQRCGHCVAGDVLSKFEELFTKELNE